MKKLNNKGYLLVEIIVAAVLAMGVAYFLINLTINFSKREEDIYKSISWTNDKNILTNMIMEDIENHNGVSKITRQGDYSVLIEFVDKVEKDLKVILTENEDGIVVGGVINYSGDYSKQLDSSLVVDEFKISSNDDYISLVIPITSVYSDEDYGIKIVALKNN